KIFMGDTGSMTVGFILAYITLHFLVLNKPTSGGDYMETAPVIAISVLIIPLFDTFRIFFWRIIQGKSPFIADNNHIHHIMLRSGYTHASASITLWSINVMIIGVTFYLAELDVNILLATVILLALLIIPFIRISGKLYRNAFINRFSVDNRERNISSSGYKSSKEINEVSTRELTNDKIPELKDS
ncbi:MAG TPA: MraY family glycosyltransferase, partial [Bacteroidales bacterium]|nr:MraY family glycosyltransferase [Bacteroidales bacterium]